MPNIPSAGLSRLVVVMGVAGSGKSTVAERLANYCGLLYLDADDFHSEEARALMSRGVPLDDQLRAPWIERVCARLRELSTESQDCVLAFPGLKKAYREPLRRTGFRATFLFLECDKDTIRGRLKHRQGHFMSPTLLDSQFETLETPVDEPDVVRLNASMPIQDVITQALKFCSP